jgi:hypothetical protein
MNLNIHSSWTTALGWLKQQDTPELQGFKLTITGDDCEIRMANRTMMGGVVRNYPDTLSLQSAVSMILDGVRSSSGWRNIPTAIASNQNTALISAINDIWQAKYHAPPPIILIDDSQVSAISEEEFLSSKYVDKGLMTGYFKLDETEIRAMAGTRRLVLKQDSDGMLFVENPLRRNRITVLGNSVSPLRGSYSLDIVGFSDNLDKYGSITRILVVEGDAEAIRAINQSSPLKE